MVNKLPEGALTSDFSLAEQIINTSWMCEQETEGRELKEPKYYLDKFYEIADGLKRDMNNGRDVEEIIGEFIVKSVDKLSFRDLVSYSEKYKGTYLTNFLDFGKINCVCASGLFMGLAEMLDYELYERCYLGNLKGHSIVRLKFKGDYKNIDMGEVRPNEDYLEEFNQIPESLPKKAILANILYNKATNILGDANSKTKFGENKNLLIAEDLYKDSLRIFDLALEIYPYPPAKINKMCSDERLGFVSNINNYNQDFGFGND